MSQSLPPDVVQKIDQELGIVHMVQGKTAEGKDFYAYVAIKPSLHEAFCHSTESGAEIELETFGIILHRGTGRGPSEDVRRYVEEEFGIDHDYVDAVERELIHLQSP